jgi:hypothetical protein
VTKTDGSAVTERDLYLVEMKSKRINQKLHGIYNREDMSALQRLAVGRLVFMYRKWMVPAYNRRWQKRNWSFQLDQEEEGFYLTTFRFLANLYKEQEHLNFHLWSKFKQLSPMERANIRRALTEISEFIALYIAYMFLSGQGPDDDDDYAYDMLRYQVARLKTEMAFYTPSPFVLTEVLTIIKSPSATVDYSKKLLRAISNVSDFWDEPLRSGPYKGYRPWVRNWVSVLPFYNQVYRSMHPHDALQFFTFTSK